MTINFFLLQIVFLIMPGFLWAKIDLSYSSNKRNTDTIFIIRSFIFSLITYFFLFIFISLINSLFHSKFIFFLETLNDNTKLDLNSLLQIFFSLIIAFLLSLIWLYLKQKKYFSKFIVCLKLSNKFGEEDIWDYSINFKNKINNDKTKLPDDTKIVSIKNIEKDIVITGYLMSFSESDRTRELFLFNVTIIKLSTDNVLYEDIPRMYISLPTNDILMEILFQEEIKYEQEQERID